jgi:hypothetical protein
MDRICQAAGATGAFLVQADVRTPDVPRTDSLRDFVNDYFRSGWHTRDVRAGAGRSGVAVGKLSRHRPGHPDEG